MYLIFIVFTAYINSQPLFITDNMVLLQQVLDCTHLIVHSNFPFPHGKNHTVKKQTKAESIEKNNEIKI